MQLAGLAVFANRQCFWQGTTLDGNMLTEENASSKNKACGHLPSAVSLEDKTTELPGPQAWSKTSQIRMQSSGEISQSSEGMAMYSLL